VWVARWAAGAAPTRHQVAPMLLARADEVIDMAEPIDLDLVVAMNGLPDRGRAAARWRRSLA
jgi:hypothetical protein